MKKFYANLDENITVIVLLFMLFLAFINVIARYVFRASISSTEEITTMLLILVSTLGSGIAAKRKAHLGLSALTDLLPQKYRRFVDFYANFFGALISVILFCTGITMAVNEYTLGQISIGLQVPTWIYCMFIPIGAASMTYHFAKVAYTSLFCGKNPVHIRSDE
jgi:C4-dicarboxylate transporter DctQ subunit